jgi:type IV pilus assembly protein PilP
MLLFKYLFFCVTPAQAGVHKALQGFIKYFIAISLFVINSIYANTDPLADLKAYCEAIHQRPVPELSALPVLPEKSDYHYTIALQRDPFSPVLTATDLTHQKSPLENYRLSELRMVGTIKQSNAMWGLVGAQDKIFRIKVGDYMGNHSGKIIAITPKEITVEEGNNIIHLELAHAKT